MRSREGTPGGLLPLRRRLKLRDADTWKYGAFRSRRKGCLAEGIVGVRRMRWSNVVGAATVGVEIEGAFTCVALVLLPCAEEGIRRAGCRTFQIGGQRAVGVYGLHACSGLSQYHMVAEHATQLNGDGGPPCRLLAVRPRVVAVEHEDGQPLRLTVGHASRRKAREMAREYRNECDGHAGKGGAWRSARVVRGRTSAVRRRSTVPPD